MRTGRLAFEEFQLDPANALLWRGDARVELAPKPFELLCRLVDRPGELITKDELLDAVWSNLHVSESSLSVAINALRSALGDDPGAPRFIETVTRRGYRFIAPVSKLSPSKTDQHPAELSYVAAPRSRWRVGRRAPLETLERLSQLSLAGNRQTVFITGEAGIGKTTFVEMTIERLLGQGVNVLWGRCIEHFGTGEAFLPLIEALQDWCRGSGGTGVVKLLRDHAPTWLAQMPGFLDERDRTSLQSEVFGATRERMLREFCEFVEALSSDRPLVLVIEDLHWSDYATLDVLSLFARRQRETSVLVLATYRRGDVVMVGHPILTVHQELQIHGHCTEIALDRLSLAEVEQYLALRFDKPEIAQALAGRVFGRTGGQPLFVVSLVDYIVVQQEIREIDGQWRHAPGNVVSRDEFPPALQDMIARQIDRLNADNQRFLEAASAAGSEFAAAMVAGAVRRDVMEVELAFEALARNGQILITAGVSEWPDGTVSGSYSFQHALYRDVLYQRLAPGQRVQTHRRLGEKLEEGYGARATEIASVLALHFEEGRDFAKAVRYLGLAADNSAKRFSNHEAAIYLGRALDLLARYRPQDHLALRIKLLQQRGWVRRAVGDLPGSLEDLNEMISCAAEAKELRSEITGLLDLSRFCLYVDRRQCLQVAERALATSSSLDDPVFKALLQGNSANLHLMLRGWRNEDADLCRQALNSTIEARDPNILMRRCSIECVLQYLSSNYLDCCVAARRGQSLAQAAGDVYFYVLYNTVEAFALLHLGEWGRLQQSVTAALSMTNRNANRQASVLCQLSIAWLQAEAFDFEGARERCEDALDSTVETNPVVFFLGRNLLAKAYLGLRNLPGAFAQFAGITHRIEVDGDVMETTIYPHFHHNLCAYWIAARDMTRARQQATRLYEIATGPPERTYLALSHRLLTEIAIAEKDFAQARAHLSRAISIVEDAELPLAAWRIYAMAAQLSEFLGELKEAARFRSRSKKVICAIADTLEPDDPLRLSLLAGFAAEIRSFAKP